MESGFQGNVGTKAENLLSVIKGLCLTTSRIIEK